jgi:hypothetical protein
MSPMRLETTRGTLSSALSLIGIGVTYFVPPDSKIIGLLFILAGILVFAWDIRIKDGHVEFGKPIRKRRMIPLIGMSVFGLGFVGCAAWYFWPAVTETTVEEAHHISSLDYSSPSTQKVGKNIKESNEEFRAAFAKEEQLGNLYEYFQDDFPNSITLTMLFRDEFGNLEYGRKNITLGFKMYFDFQANTKFISFYIPAMNRTELVYTTCVDVAGVYQKIMDQLAANLHMAQPSPGDSSVGLSENLKFTGRIFIYTENFLSDEQVAKLITLFAEKGASVTFRGPNYYTYRELQKKAAAHH